VRSELESRWKRIIPNISIVFRFCALCFRRIGTQEEQRLSCQVQCCERAHSLDSQAQRHGLLHNQSHEKTCGLFIELQ
jgi:hypothetical protein